MTLSLVNTEGILWVNRCFIFLPHALQMPGKLGSSDFYLLLDVVSGPQEAARIRVIVNALTFLQDTLLTGRLLPLWSLNLQNRNIISAEGATLMITFVWHSTCFLIRQYLVYCRPHISKKTALFWSFKKKTDSIFNLSYTYILSLNAPKIWSVPLTLLMCQSQKVPYCGPCHLPVTNTFFIFIPIFYLLWVFCEVDTAASEDSLR